MKHKLEHWGVAEALAMTPQHPEYHAEGNVLTHTHLVIGEATRLAEQHQLSPVRTEALLLAAAGHDLGKITATQADFSAPGHAQRSATHLAQLLLSDPEVSVAAALQALVLVRNHHRLLDIAADQQAAPRERRADLALLRSELDTELLALLHQADAAGRLPQGDDSAAELLLSSVSSPLRRLGDPDPSEPWRAAVQSQLPQLPARQARRSAQASWAAHLRGEIFTPEEAVQRALGQPNRTQGAHLNALCGLSGSGKSTLAARYAAAGDLRAELDAERSAGLNEGQARQAAQEAIRAAFRSGQAVTYDATGLRRDRRSQPLRLAREYRASTSLDILWVTPAQAHAQEQRRARKVGAHVIAAQLRQLQWPTHDEGYDQVRVRAAGHCYSLAGHLTEDFT